MSNAHELRPTTPCENPESVRDLILRMVDHLNSPKVGNDWEAVEEEMRNQIHREVLDLGGCSWEALEWIREFQFAIDRSRRFFDGAVPREDWVQK